MQLAASAFRTHRQTSFADRASKMMRAAEILEKEKDECAHLMTLEMGKPLKAAVGEALKCATGCRYYAENAEKFLADEIVETGAKRSFIRYLPIGPILAIMPWNFPFWQVFRFAAPALMAGNVGLLKHASNVPQCALKIEDILHRAGFAEGVFQTLLIGSGPVDGILNDPRVVAATLTGSEQAGIQVGISAAKRIKKVVLELGGSDPFIVMPSADLDAAVATAVDARIQNNGQSCIAAKRFIVAEKIADEFERKFVQRMQELRVGDPFDPSTQLGPLVNADAVTTLDADVKKTCGRGCARADRWPSPGPSRQLLRADGARRHSERFAGLQGRILWPGGVNLSREGCGSCHPDRQRQPFRVGRQRLDERSRGNRKVHQRTRCRNGFPQQDGGFRSAPAFRWREVLGPRARTRACKGFASL